MPLVSNALMGKNINIRVVLFCYEARILLLPIAGFELATQVLEMFKAVLTFDPVPFLRKEYNSHFPAQPRDE